MEDTFGTQVTGRVVHGVPAAPKTGVIRPQEGKLLLTLRSSPNLGLV